MEQDFIELIGEAETKPFECVGSISEVIYALNRIEQYETEQRISEFEQKLSDLEVNN